MTSKTNSKTIIVSNRLPVKVVRKEGEDLDFQPTEGGLATGLGSIYKSGNNVWIGWPGATLVSEQEEKSTTEILESQSMYPVFLTDEDLELYYEGFSNETLWPNFHYFNQYSIFDERTWESYKAVNQKFADAVLSQASEEDTIWVHDYQLLLVPALLRKEKPDLKIGFFLHIPFPSYESFRLLPFRRELLLGMLGADFLGFHTYDDTRHFLSSANRLAGIGNNHGIINYNNRQIMADALPMGIDYEKYSSTASEPETIEKEVQYRTAIGTPQMMLSIDRLDYSKGIPQRVKAFEQFLVEYPQYRTKVSLVMIVVPSRYQVGKYKELKEEIDLLVGRINGQFGRLSWTPVHYFFRSYPLNALSAFYRMAHVGFVSPLRDGMNLVAKEFIASKLEKKGVLILSEMAGASKELSDAILVNPNNRAQMVRAIKDALEMSEEEQISRMTVMQETLKRYNIYHWVDLFMSRLAHVKKQQLAQKTKNIDSKTIEGIRKDYLQAKQRLLFLDYDGTLTGFHPDPQLAVPNEELYQILDQLIEKENTRVVIISGRDKNTLQKWFDNRPIDLIAEHGVWLRQVGGDWETITHLTDVWKGDIKDVLEGYVNRTPGSFIEEKDYSLVWHYRKVETGLGELRTRELMSHLKYLTSNMNLQVLEGDKVMEIKSTEVNKGRAAASWLKRYTADFVLAIGDDWTDEDTFKAMPDSAFTIKVGGNQSAAKYSILGPEKVRGLLRKLGE
ncbi:bifunctional alpha,alpha-trehalose-phosphate synthase (UDP-forming)/trehalose-phosphatase [Reichenbachiella sp. 5M10]|uniref:bifunctional alpha,alpha-trehalose-phosphate synthase (UDP-forming)/trehalose-phosphatase n=1 Tax=Reichenbachiella sp. 5M10 TaxID=1889772 RepID=UPI000C14C553|nr:bifunctional alpha,alpha-trehalose-phosphate synthase (UDP-forming)/trehalose-phosphatase [Reichenbachiella sp. 5M10]PIB37048.1 bifunctional alpha,alpha-trehalose-phosphate synthase (UDP-forming)/trehalose-phosphatase [Reichenbachiella sp. 5M10]